MKSIFDIEIRIDYKKEFYKMINYFHYENYTTYACGEYYTLIDAINILGFKKWPYRGTAIDCEEYLDNIGLPDYVFRDSLGITKEQFLYYVEFIYNIIMFSLNNNYISIKEQIVKTMIENINIIVEKLNYKFELSSDKYLLVKRDENVDSILSLVDEDITKILLEYNDFKIKDNLHRKGELLKSIDKYIEKNQSDYSKLDNDSYRTWGYIVNNFGVNHKINEKYKGCTNDDILKWYDKAFLIGIHLIRTRGIKEINKERKELEI